MKSDKLTGSGVSTQSRLKALLFTFIVLMAVLLVRVGYWSIVQSEWLNEQSNSLVTEDMVIDADRGKILDRNGSVLVQSASADTVVVRPKEITDAFKVADVLSSVLQMDRTEIYQKAIDTEKSEIWIKRQITKEQAEEISSYALDGVDFISDIKRYYPNSDLACHLLGITTVDGDGMSGIEKQYDKYLSGKDGRIIAETDKNGNEIVNGGELYIDASAGYDVILTVDSVIQNILDTYCNEALEKTCADSVEAVVINPNTGEVLAMTDVEGYDLNDIPRTDKAVMQQIIHNRNIENTYRPGSLFEIFTLASAIDSGIVDCNNYNYDCSGYYLSGDEYIECEGEGNMNSQGVVEILMNSCTASFVDMTREMGYESFYSYLERFGFGSKTGIDLPLESSGELKQIKYINESELSGISYGKNLAVTPVQFAGAFSSLVNGGSMYKLHTVLEVDDGDTAVQQYGSEVTGSSVSGDTSAEIIEILGDIINKSGNANDLGGYTYGGLSGIMYKNSDDFQNEELKCAAYVGFAPLENPSYVILMIIDNPSVDDEYVRNLALPYAENIIESILKYSNVKTVTSDYETIELPDVSGLSVDEAAEQLESLGFEVDIVGEGIVRNQMPSGDSTVIKGSEVILYCNTEDDETDTDNSNSDMSSVPDVTGMDVKEAKTVIENSGFRFEARSTGTAVRQKPEAGSIVSKGTNIVVYFEMDLS